MPKNMLIVRIAGNLYRNIIDSSGMINNKAINQRSRCQINSLEEFSVSYKSDVFDYVRRHYVGAPCISLHTEYVSSVGEFNYDKLRNGVGLAGQTMLSVNRV